MKRLLTILTLAATAFFVMPITAEAGHPVKKRCHTGHANKHKVYRNRVTSYHRPNYRTNHSYRYRVAPRPVIRYSSSAYRPVYRSSGYSNYGYGGYGYGYRPVSSLSFFFGSGGYCR